MQTKLIGTIVFLALVWASVVTAADKDRTVTMEYYYKIKWGHQEESRRFELLEAHWDLAVSKVELDQ